MKERKKYGDNMSTDIKTKEELLEALQREAGKPADELDADKIDRLTRLLEQYDEDKHTNVSNYEEFLQRFNEKNNTSLTSREDRRKQSGGIKTFKIAERRRCSIAAAAMLLIVLVVSAQTLSTAMIDKSGSNWITMENGWIRFHIENSKYDSWVEIDEEGTMGYISGNPNAIKMQAEQYSTKDINEVKKLGIMIPYQLPEGYDINSIDIVDLDSKKGTISINYKKSKNNQILFTAFMENSEDGYEWSFKHDDSSAYIGCEDYKNFTAYLFQEEGRVEAYFCCKGVVYSVRGETSLEEMHEVLESVAYPE